jgi:hypothetical protein
MICIMIYEMIAIFKTVIILFISVCMYHDLTVSIRAS